jgi:hypothetical protein
VLQRSRRANPATEESAQEKRGKQNHEAHDQAAVKGVTRQRVRDSNQWIDQKEQPHRRAQMNISGRARCRAQRRKNEQHNKHEEEEDLRDPAQQRQSGTDHGSPPHQPGWNALRNWPRGRK